MAITKGDVLLYLQGLSSPSQINSRFVIGQFQDNWPDWLGDDIVPPQPELDSVAPLTAMTGKVPGLIGVQWGNFSFPEAAGGHWHGVLPWIANAKAQAIQGLIDYWNAGSLVQVGYRPAHPTTGLRSDTTPVNLANLLNGTTTCTWWERGVQQFGTFEELLDYHIADLLALQAAGVVVIHRLFEEMNLNGPSGAIDWWWANFSASDFRTLWQFCHAYFAEQGVTNLLWSFQGFMNKGNMLNYYPGSTYVDIVGVSWYFPATFPAGNSDYTQLATLGKVMMAGEVGFNSAPINLNAYVESLKANAPLLVGGSAWPDPHALYLQSNVVAGMANPWLVTQPVPVLELAPVASFDVTPVPNTLTMQFTDTSV